MALPSAAIYAFAQAPVEDLVTRHVRFYQSKPEAAPPLQPRFPHTVTTALPATLPLEEVYQPFAPAKDAETQRSRLLDPRFQQELSQKLGFGLSYGNKLTVLKNGETFQEKIRLLDAAQTSFIGATMLFNCDPTVETLVQKMIAKRRRGVEIYLILDAFFALPGFTDCHQRLVEAGVHLLYNKESSQLANRIFFHDKFWVRDGVEALIEGPNVIDAQAVSTGFNGLYRDSGVRIEGPVVTDLLAEAQLLWKYLSKDEKSPISLPVGEAISTRVARETQQGNRDIENHGFSPVTDRLKAMDGACRLVFQGPHRKRDTVSQIYSAYIDSAQSYIAIPTQRRPYRNYRPERSRPRWEDILLKRIFEKSYIPGMRVDFFMNFHNTPFTVAPPNPRPTPPIARAMKNWDRLTLKNRLDHALEFFTENSGPGLEVWSYFQYFHSKHVLIDKVAAGMGSFNLDKLSAAKNHEMVLICHDHAFVRQVQEMTALDLLNSVPMLRRSR